MVSLRVAYGVPGGNVPYCAPYCSGACQFGTNKDGSPLDSPHHDMLQRTRPIQARPTRHGTTEAPLDGVLSRCELIILRASPITLLNIMGQKFGFDPVFFGLIMVILMQIGGITPPVGILLNLTCGLARVKTEETIKYVCICVAVMVFVVCLVIAFPPIAMVLPNMFLKQAK
jgi:hypothetical protein